ncbi:hypothetical protein BU15DRAFT_76903 [Melanogaster broomeanus]|nr:hypothetical protein BU15DRAFT_76903 [Melanogaster broomeanus]
MHQVVRTALVNELTSSDTAYRRISLFAFAQDPPIVPTLEHMQGLIGAKHRILDSIRSLSCRPLRADQCFDSEAKKSSTVMEKPLDTAAARDHPRAIDKGENLDPDSIQEPRPTPRAQRRTTSTRRDDLEKLKLASSR